MANATRPRVIIDCDPGHDDAIALILAHRHAEVLGVTTVSGNAPLPATTANALLVLALLNVDTPLHVGAAKPLVGAPVHATGVHGENGLAGVDRPPHERTPTSDDAVGFLLDAAAPDVWIIAIGPLTNLALAIDRDPQWPQRIAGISIMGGSAGVGNATAVAEFNIFADPEAAARVFACGADITMCGLNLTHQLRTTDAIVETLWQSPQPGSAKGPPLARKSPQPGSARGLPLAGKSPQPGSARGLPLAGKSPVSTAQFAAQAFTHLHDLMGAWTGIREAALHDPCAVLAVTHPHLITAQPRPVAVETSGELTRGMTVVDERRKRPPTAAKTRVGYGIDADAAMALVLDALGA